MNFLSGMSQEVVNGIFAIAGAIVGALIAGAFALHIARRGRDHKMLILSIVPPSQLLVVHDTIQKDVEIKISGHPVNNLVLSEFYISNAGNRAVENIKFPASLPGGCIIFSSEVLDRRTNARRAGAVLVPEDDSAFTVLLDYLNPGEEVSVRTILTGPAPEWEIEIRQPELEVSQREASPNKYSSVMVEMLLAAISEIPFGRAYLRIMSPAFRKFQNRIEAHKSEF